MTSDELKKLRSYYHSLTSLEPILENAAKVSGLVKLPTVNLLGEELVRISKEFPDLLPPLDFTPYARRDNREYYYAEGVRSIVGLALGRLKVAIEDTEPRSVIDNKVFPFV